MPTDDPDDVLIRFLDRFGAAEIVRLPLVAAGPHMDELKNFAGQLMTARLDGALLLSAAGTRQLLERAADLEDSVRFLDALRDARLVIAGQGAARVLERQGIRPQMILASSSDWRLILNQLATLPEMNSTRLVIESTRHDVALRAGLESRGVTAIFLPMVAAPCPASGTKNPNEPGAMLVCDADGLATVCEKVSSQESGAARGELRQIVFATSPEIVQSAELLGLEARLIDTVRLPAGWGIEEALEIARQLW